jgi:nucleoside-diphosphate-sugar epimerase
MRIACVGGAGFIGHHLALKLKRQHEVLIIDSLAVNNKYVLQGAHEQAIIAERLLLLGGADIPLAIADARDYHATSRILAEFRPECLLHLAAVAHLDRANKDPHSTFDHSLRTLENSLDIARSLKCHFIYFSSSTVYGDFKTGVYDETSPLEPRGIYGSLKQCGEIMVRAYGALYDLPYTIVRPCALYGPRCVSGRVIQRFIEAAERGETLKVEGDGREKIDFTYVDDLVAGVERVIGNPAARGEVFNLTAGRARSLNDVVSILRTRYPSLRAEFVTRDQQRPERGTLSVNKASRLIGYEPKFTLELGMAEYLDWYKRFWGKEVAA